MTPEQRAEKIVNQYFQNIIPEPVKNQPQLIGLIASQIAEAEREAAVKEYEGDCSNVAKIEQEAYKKGFSAAREKAAGKQSS